MSEAKNTYYEFKFPDGDKTELTMAFYLLVKLKAKNKDLYDRYNNLIMNGTSDILDMITIVYTAYVCAHIDDDEIMSEEDFTYKCGNDTRGVTVAVVELTRAKKA